jgi:hypothetical protein
MFVRNVSVKRIALKSVRARRPLGNALVAIGVYELTVGTTAMNAAPPSGKSSSLTRCMSNGR